jgi:hypothetical protein
MAYDKIGQTTDASGTTLLPEEGHNLKDDLIKIEIETKMGPK